MNFETLQIKTARHDTAEILSKMVLYNKHK